MLKRCIAAGIVIPILVGIWMISSRWYELPTFFLTFIAGMIINGEILVMSESVNTIKYPFIFISIGMTVSLLSNYLLSVGIIDLKFFLMIQVALFVLGFYLTLLKELVRANHYEKNIEFFGFVILSYVTLVHFYPSFLIMKTILPHSWALIFLFSFCWINDAAGLISGKLFGRRKLTNFPSKSKTLEGYIGAVLLTTLLGVLCFYIQDFLRLPFHWPLIKWVCFGFTLSFSANIGDLIESLLKRYTNQKDSGNTIPGIGGIFDSIDSQIYSIPLAILFFV